MLRGVAARLRRPHGFLHGMAEFSSAKKAQSTHPRNALRTEWSQMQTILPSVDVNDVLHLWERSCTEDRDLLPQVWQSIQDHYPAGIAQEMLSSTCAELWSKRKFDEVIAIAPLANASELSVDVVDYVVRAHCAMDNIADAEAFLEASPHASNLTLQSRLVLAYASKRNIAQVKSIIVERIVQQPTHMWTAQCCRNVMSALCQLRDVSSMFEFLRRMTDRGIEPDSFVLASLLDACVATDNPAEAARVLAIIPTLDLAPHPVLNHAILQALVVLDDFDALLPVIADLKSLPPHPSTPRVLRHVCAAAIEARHYDLAATCLSSPDQFADVVQHMSPSSIPTLLATVSTWQSLTPAQWTSLLNDASQALQFHMVLELFLSCPESPDPSMLAIVENACVQVQASESSALLESVAAKCSASLLSESPLASTRVALVTICLRFGHPQLVADAITSATPSASKQLVLVGLPVARKLRQKRTFRTLYLAAPPFVRRDAQVHRSYTSLMAELRLPVLPPSLDNILALVQARDYAEATALLSKHPIVSTEATWLAFLSHLVPSLDAEAGVAERVALDEWSFATDACLSQKRYAQAIDLFAARVRTTRTHRSAFVPRPTALLQLETAVSGVADEQRDAVKATLLPLLTAHYLSCPEAFPLPVRMGLMRVGLVLDAPELTLLVLPEKPKQWDRTILRMVLTAAAQTNQLMEMYRRAPKVLQGDSRMQRELFHHLVLRDPHAVDWAEVATVAGWLRKSKGTPSAETWRELADAGAFGGVLRVRTMLSMDVKGPLKSHPRWKNFLDTLAPQVT